MSAEERVAVLTSASHGIGAALARVLGDIAERETAQQVISEGLARFSRITARPDHHHRRKARSGWHLAGRDH